jgi:hypothetical protein
VPEKAPRNGVLERTPKNDIPEESPKNDVLERAPRNGMLERVPRNDISERAPKSGVLEGTPRNGVPEGASKNGVSERAPCVAVESVIFHQLPTSVTRNRRATFFCRDVSGDTIRQLIGGIHNSGVRISAGVRLYRDIQKSVGS